MSRLQKLQAALELFNEYPYTQDWPCFDDWIKAEFNKEIEEQYYQGFSYWREEKELRCDHMKEDDLEELKKQIEELRPMASLVIPDWNKEIYNALKLIYKIIKK